MQKIELGNLITVRAKIPPNFSNLSLENGKVVVNFQMEKLEDVTFEGKVVKMSEDGEVESVQLTKPMKIKSEFSVGSIIYTQTLLDVQIELLSD